MNNKNSKARVGVPDVMIVLGMMLLAAGLGGIDWRLAAIVCGALIVGLGVWMIW